MADDEYGKEPSDAEVAAMVAFLAFAIDRYVKNRARRTIVENAQSDPAKPKCRWIVESDACDFCRQRGSFLYGPKEMPIGSHGGCKCHPGTVYSQSKEGESFTENQNYRGRSVEIDTAPGVFQPSSDASAYDDPRLELQDLLHSGRLTKTINPDVQKGHFEGTKEWAERIKDYKPDEVLPGSLDIGIEECQDLVDRLSGSGIIRIYHHSVDNIQVKETCVVEGRRIIGTWRHKKLGVESPTDSFTIHYSSKGNTHIVPSMPSWIRIKSSGREGL